MRNVGLALLFIATAIACTSVTIAAIGGTTHSQTAEQAMVTTHTLNAALDAWYLHLVLPIVGMSIAVAFALCGTAILVGLWIVHVMRDAQWRQIGGLFRDALTDDTTHSGKTVELFRRRSDRTA